MKAKEGYKALNLVLPKALVKLMKIHCIENETDVSTLTESLYSAFLKEEGVRASNQPIMIPKQPLPIKKAAEYLDGHPADQSKRAKTSQDAPRSKLKYKKRGGQE